MKHNNRLFQLVISAVLCAIGIIIPLFSPIKILMEPASYTLASHVAIFIAMFVSPGVAVAVSIGTTIGFFLGGFPIVIVLRAASHVIFALLGAVILKKKPQLLDKTFSALVFGLLIGVVHAASEVLVVIPFYFGNNMSQAYYAKGFIESVMLLVGVGGLVHSMVDFGISLIIWKPLKKIA